MKPGIKLWAFMGIGVLLIAAAALGIYRAQQVAEQKRLADDLQVTKNRLAALEIDAVKTQQQSVLNQITQTKLSADQIKATVSAPLNSISASDTLLRIAQEVGVIVEEVSSDDPYEAKFAGLPCIAMPVRATVTGDWAKLVTYVDRLQNFFTVLYIDTAEINSQTETLLNLKVLVYTYKGS